MFFYPSDQDRLVCLAWLEASDDSWGRRFAAAYDAAVARRDGDPEQDPAS